MRFWFFYTGLSRPFFGCISLLVKCLQLTDWHTIIDNEDRKQERRIEVSLIVWSKTSLIEKAQYPARIETVCRKSHGWPGIRTRPARTETCCSTACATTNMIVGSKTIESEIAIRGLDKRRGFSLLTKNILLTLVGFIAGEKCQPKNILMHFYSIRKDGKSNYLVAS